MQDFKNLKVWQRSHHLVKMIYHITHHFPQEEIFNLTRQIRRSAISIASNISEGCGRGSDTDFARFIQIAIGSASELEYRILLAKELDYLTVTEYSELTEEIIKVKKMLTSLKKKLNSYDKIKHKAESR